MLKDLSTDRDKQVNLVVTICTFGVFYLNKRKIAQCEWQFIIIIIIIIIIITTTTTTTTTSSSSSIFFIWSQNPNITVLCKM
jgi:hypothetical protein